RNADDPQLYRWDISRNEYFLIEYRNRDLNASGVELTIREPDGARVRQQFTNSDTDFIYQYAGFDTLLAAGTLLIVSNFDWSLPGGLDLGPDEKEGTEDDRELNGGLLIWHIDEGVIQRAFDAQAQGGDRGVNEDPHYRGVDLEEADGAQDIGLDAGLLDNSPSFGYAYDFWWENNNYRVITENGSIDLNPDNVFGPQTYPNNASNAGARQYFELFDIQATGSTAQFSIRYAAPDASAPALAANIQDFLPNGLLPVHSYYQSYPLSVGRVIVGPQGVTALGGQAGAPSDTLIVVQAEQSMHLLSLNQLKSKKTLTAEDWIRLPEMVGPLQPVLEDRIITAERQANDSQLRIRSWNYIPGDDSLVQRWEQIIASELGSIGLGEQLGYLSSAGNITGVGDAESSILVEYLGLQLDKTGQISASDWQLETALIEFQENGDHLTGSFQARWNQEQIQVDGWSADELSALEQSSLLGSTERSQWIPIAQGSTVRLVQVSETEVGVFDPNAADVYTLIYSTQPSEMVAQWPAISKKGQLFHVNSSENTIEGYYLSGAMLDYFPLPAPDSVRWTGSPLLADLNGDEEQELLLVGQNPYATLLYAYTLQGDPLLGFPLSVGAGGFNPVDSGVGQGSGLNEASRIQIPGIVGSFVTAIAPSGELSIWEFPNMGNADWPSRMGPWGWNRAVQTGEDSGLPGGGDNEAVLVTTETYNWPNPAKDHTNVRFQTSGAGQVQIHIIDLSGQLIYERQIQSRGGSPEEITIDTSQWPSGAYIALVKATVAGKTGSKLVKMAIAK
ncbi:T9SS type A sorting domain-containing protein, partial [Bacteroidota bacterium]|nr:T9SS type A sorting domain-containing protein [Bacteroidota bacterium]